MKVWYTQLKGYNGPVVWDSLEEVLEEIKGLADEITIGDSFIITAGEMTREEFDALEEFQGY